MIRVRALFYVCQKSGVEILTGKPTKSNFGKNCPGEFFSGPRLFFNIWLKMTKQSNILVAGLSKKLQVQLITF